jgi:hypothetical protein
MRKYFPNFQIVFVFWSNNSGLKVHGVVLVENVFHLRVKVGVVLLEFVADVHRLVIIV